MYAVRDLTHRTVGWMAGDVLYNTQGDVCAFVRGTEVFTFRRRHVGGYDHGLFRNTGGDIVGSAWSAPYTPHRRQRRRRFRITPWVRFSLPTPRADVTFRTWAIWDRAIDEMSA